MLRPRQGNLDFVFFRSRSSSIGLPKRQDTRGPVERQQNRPWRMQTWKLRWKKNLESGL